jgi:hypothetical protein
MGIESGKSKEQGNEKTGPKTGHEASMAFLERVGHPALSGAEVLGNGQSEITAPGQGQTGPAVETTEQGIDPRYPESDSRRGGFKLTRQITGDPAIDGVSRPLKDGTHGHIINPFRQQNNEQPGN